MGGSRRRVTVFFADIRGFTALSETQTPEEMARLVNHFYAIAADVLARHEAVIDKLVGDEVMALFVPGFAGGAYVAKMVDAADALLRAIGYGTDAVPWLPLGIGLDHGPAFVGNVGSGEVKDFTAIGDVVNTAARLQAEARPGQIVISERVYQEVSSRYPDAKSVELTLKGKAQLVAARVIDLNTAPVAA